LGHGEYAAQGKAGVLRRAGRAGEILGESKKFGREAKKLLTSAPAQGIINAVGPRM
jgi:hypothetical protein